VGFFIYSGFNRLVWNWQDELNIHMFNWNLQSNYRRLSKYVHGVETILVQDNIDYNTNTWYNIEVYSINGKQGIVIPVFFLLLEKFLYL